MYYSKIFQYFKKYQSVIITANNIFSCIGFIYNKFAYSFVLYVYLIWNTNSVAFDKNDANLVNIKLS